MISTPFEDSFRGTVLSLDPLTIYSESHIGRPSKNSMSLIANSLHDRDINFLFLTAWYSGGPGHDEKTVSFASSLESPRHRVTILSNTQEEADRLLSMGVKSKHFNHNIFVNEDIFMRDPSQSASYSAIYNAQLQRFKRIELARKVNGKIALVSYNPDKAYMQEILALKQFILLNNVTTNGSLDWLKYNDLVKAYSSSCCGLALSAVEGAMHSSMEYLMCGLPIVSTTNKGGRDEFLNSENCIYAD